jgi:hypothetical protein
MGFQIQDGTGKGFNVGVDKTNRLLSRTINETIFENSAEEGEAYFMGTPLVTLTNAALSAVFFVVNNEDFDLIFDNFFFIAEATTGGSPAIFRSSWYKGSTAMSSATSFTPLNQNFGSSKTLSGTFQYGAQGAAFTGGEVVTQLSFPIGQFNDIPAKLVLPKGSSFGIGVTPPTGNTSMAVQFGARAIRYIEQY